MRPTEIPPHLLAGCLNALQYLRVHLQCTLDLHAVGSQHVVPQSDFLERYYTSLPELEAELSAVLQVPAFTPILVIGRAGTGKTTFVTASLSLQQASVGFPFVRVPFVKAGTAALQGETPLSAALEASILAELRHRLSIREQGPLRTWMTVVSYAAAVFTFEQSLGPALESGLRRLRIAYESLASACTFTRWLEQAYDEKVPAVLAALSQIDEEATMADLCQAISVVSAGDHTKYVHIFVDNIENAEAFDAICEMRRSIRDLPLRLTRSARMIYAMRYTSLRALSEDVPSWNALRSAVEGAEAAAQPTEQSRVNVASVIFELVHVPGQFSVSAERYWRLAEGVVSKRLDLLSDTDSERLVRAVKRDCLALLQDEYVRQTLAFVSNYNLRDMNVILGNLVEGRLKEDLASIGTPASSDFRERRHPAASLLYEQLGLLGIGKLLERQASEERERRVMSVFDPVAWIEMYRARNAKHALRDRLLVALICRATRRHGDLQRGQGTVSFSDLRRSMAILGYDEAEVAAGLETICGDELLSGYVESNMERYGQYNIDPSSGHYSILPRGVGYLDIVEYRYGYWRACVERGEYRPRALQRKVAASMDGNSHGLFLSVIAALIEVAQIEVAFVRELSLNREVSLEHGMIAYLSSLHSPVESRQGFALTALTGIGDYHGLRPGVSSGPQARDRSGRWLMRGHNCVSSAWANLRQGVDPGAFGSVLLDEISKAMVMARSST